MVGMAWLANHDFSPCTSVHAVINYAAKYCSKAEKKTASYSELAQQVAGNIASTNSFQSFIAKMLNKLVGERDFFAQEVCHLLLGLPLQVGSGTIETVDCRPRTNQSDALDLEETERNTRRNKYDTYLARDISLPHLAELSYFDFRRSWDSRALDSIRWKRFLRAKPRILSFFPIYKADRSSPEVEDFYRVKLML